MKIATGSSSRVHFESALNSDDRANYKLQSGAHGSGRSLRFARNLKRNQLRLESPRSDCAISDSKKHPQDTRELSRTAQVQPQQQTDSEPEGRHQEMDPR